MQLFGNRSVHVNSNRNLLQEISNFERNNANKINISPLNYLKKFDQESLNEKENGG